MRHFTFNLIILTVVSAFSGGCFATAGEDQQPATSCNCPLQKQTTGESGSVSDSATNSWGADGNLQVDIPLVKRLIKGEIGLSGQYENDKTRVEQAYWQILDGNPQITQYANLYWATACALYEIACEDQTIDEPERAAEKRQIIRDYDARLAEIIHHSPSKINETGKKETPVNRRALQPVTRNSPNPPLVKLPGSTNPQWYFSKEYPTEIAIVQLGDNSHKDLAVSFSNWLDNRGYVVNSAFFNASFLGRFRSQLKNEEAGIFSTVGAHQFTNCVCLFDQSTVLQEAALAGEKLITAIFSGKVTLFNLKNNSRKKFAFEVRGAGITIARAMESVEEKLEVEFADLETKLSLCH